MDFEILIGGEYKLLLKPIAYYKFEGVMVATTATKTLQVGVFGTRDGTSIGCATVIGKTDIGGVTTVGGCLT